MFKNENTTEFINWLSDTRDHISQFMSKLATKDNLTEDDESFLEEMFSYYYIRG